MAACEQRRRLATGIGLPRAKVEYERLSPAERELSGGLVDPDMIAAAVLGLATDPDSAG